MNRLSKIGSQIIGSVAIGSQILAKLARVAASSSVRLCVIHKCMCYELCKLCTVHAS